MTPSATTLARLRHNVTACSTTFDHVDKTHDFVDNINDDNVRPNSATSTTTLADDVAADLDDAALVATTYSTSTHNTT